ncbi:hypothetical protein ABEB36_009713 [Hypothenemus hampei]|uniref:G-protein coupled receptors family 1 profile domain-containing protein n=1 Tax=Hypothenemus hampei TaxID=57062 RepID=A0ABD1EH75_HYPHA
MSTLILSVVLTIICTVGIIFNLYTILVILLTRQGNTANNVLLLHLGVVNILIGILFLFFCLPGIKGTEWVKTGAPCAVNGFLFTLLQPLAVWTICGLNCDRYYAIAAPLHYSHIVSIKKVLIGLVVGWVNSLILAVPPLFNATPYRYMDELGACAPEFRTGPASIWYATGYTAFTLLLPATVFICCNAKILIIARYHRHRIASAIFEVALSAQVTITHQRNPLFVPTVTAPSAGGPKFRGSNPVMAVLLMVMSFLVICVPYYVLILYEAAVHSFEGTLLSFDVRHLYMCTGILLVCSPMVNGYLYGLKNKNLRKAFMNYWRKKQTKNEVHHEIQARTPSTCGSRKPSLTPFGVFPRNANSSRRMSETLFDVNRSLKSPHKSKIKRITSELMWMHGSATSLNMSPKDESPPKSIKQTISCNTLRVPEEPCSSSIVDEAKIESPTSRSSIGGTFLQKLFKFEIEKNVKKREIIMETTTTSPKRLEDTFSHIECLCSNSLAASDRQRSLLPERIRKKARKAHKTVRQVAN